MWSTASEAIILCTNHWTAQKELDIIGDIYAAFKNWPVEGILVDNTLHKHWIQMCLEAFLPCIPQRFLTQAKKHNW